MDEFSVFVNQFESLSFPLCPIFSVEAGGFSFGGSLVFGCVGFAAGCVGFTSGVGVACGGAGVGVAACVFAGFVFGDFASVLPYSYLYLKERESK